MVARFYRTAFWALVMFILGNATAFVTFGLNTVSKTEFVRYENAVEAHLSSQDTHIQKLEQTNANLVGQLKARQEIDVIP